MGFVSFQEITSCKFFRATDLLLLFWCFAPDKFRYSHSLRKLLFTIHEVLLRVLQCSIPLTREVSPSPHYAFMADLIRNVDETLLNTCCSAHSESLLYGWRHIGTHSHKQRRYPPPGTLSQWWECSSSCLAVEPWALVAYNWLLLGVVLSCKLACQFVLRSFIFRGYAWRIDRGLRVVVPGKTYANSSFLSISTMEPVLQALWYVWFWAFPCLSAAVSDS